MSRADCPNLVMIEARRDGRLAPNDVASLERHLRTCAECTAHERELDRIGNALREDVVDDPSPLEHRRARASLLRAAAATPSVHRRRGVFIWAPAAALVAAAAIVAIVALPSEPDSNSTPSAAHRTETRVTPEPGARFTRTTEGDLDRVSLDEGAIRAEVKKLGAGERFLVRTGDAEIEVRGTIFRVEARDGALRAVDVVEGVVEVRLADEKWRVEAGGTWRPTVIDAAAAKRSAEPAAASASAPPAPADRSPPTSAPSASAPPPRVAAPATPTPAPSASNAAAASRSLQEAIAAIERGDYGHASKTLEKARTAETDPERAELAVYLHAVALQRAGRPEDARRAASDYLARYPGGRFVAEAKRIAAGP